MEHKDGTLSFFEETRKMQQLARERVERVLDEQEMLNLYLEEQRKKIDSRSKELNKREAHTEREKQKLDEEIRELDLQNSCLHMASLEQKKAGERFLRLLKEQTREKEEVMKKVLEFETQLVAKQKLEMGIEELKGKVQVMKHLGDGDDAAVQGHIQKLNDELEAKMEEMNQTLVEE